jgi:putative tricarboxylic transport membrane protein
MTRRRLMKFAAMAASLPLVSPMVWAQNLDRIKILAPGPHSGGWELTGRALGQALIDIKAIADWNGQHIQGQAGHIGFRAFIERWGDSDPDALLLTGSAMLGGALYRKAPLALKNVTPLARLTREHNVFVVAKNSPIKSIQDAVAQNSIRTGNIRWGGGSHGSTDSVTTFLLARAAGIDPKKLVYVPLNGGDQMTNALEFGAVSIVCAGYCEVQAAIKKDKLRALAITSENPVKDIKIPTLREQGFDVVTNNWRGVYAGGKITSARREELIRMLDKTRQSAAWQASLTTHGWQPDYLAGADFERFVDSDFESLKSTLSKAGMV